MRHSSAAVAEFAIEVPARVELAGLQLFVQGFTLDPDAGLRPRNAIRAGLGLRGQARERGGPGDRDGYASGNVYGAR